MPDLTEQSTPPPPAIPPIVDPGRFEDFPAFRESFLAIFTMPEHNAALRAVGGLIFEMALEFRGYWPSQPEGSLRTELRALVADLRVAQGHLASLGDSEASSPSSRQEAHHVRVSARLAVDIGAVADALEAELGSWRGEP
jgi:hypothetical protein